MSAAWSSRLGRIGAWFHPGYGDEARTEFAVEAETLGYPVAWLGFGPASVADLAVVEQILRATSTIVVATAIVNMWTNEPKRSRRPTGGSRQRMATGCCSVSAS